MALSGVVAIRFIIENTHSTRLIPLIAGGVTSRSKEIRKNCIEFLVQLLDTWETHHLEKHVNLIANSIKKGISDADQEARVFARKAFWSFSAHYSTAADSLLNSFDAKTQKSPYDFHSKKLKIYLLKQIYVKITLNILTKILKKARLNFA